MRTSLILHFCTCIASFLSVARAFNVTVGTPTQCDDLPVSWTGGQAPFEIIVTPFAPSQPLHNISVPASAFSNGKGSYSIPQFPFKDETQFLLTMSDNTGFGSGGTSTILTVGPPVANNNCNTTISPPDFFFSTPLELQQCNDYSFTTYDGAVLPVTITGLIPGGEFVSLYGTGSSYTWIADVAAGTNLIFFMIDSQGRQGGVSPLNTVQPLSNTSCLNVNSPSSTASAPSQTSSQSTPSGSNTATVGIIAGATVGGVVLLVLSIILGIFCIRKASRSSVANRYSDADHKVKQNFTSQHYPPMQPGSPSHLVNVSANDPFSQHLRQGSYTGSFAGSSSISSPNTSPSQLLPVGLARPTNPGTHSYLTHESAGGFAFNDLYAPFNPIQQSSGLSSNLDAFAGYGDAGSSSIASASRRMAGQTATQNYTFQYQTHPVRSPTSPNQPGVLSHQTSADRFTASDPPSPLPTHPSRLSSDIDGAVPSPVGRMAAAAGRATTNPSAHVIVHTDIEDVPSPDAQGVIELPPQYADRQHPVSQFASAPHQKASLS